MEIQTEVPSHFLCPISMQPMKDPVTVSTGITYDRESIERWLFTCKRTSCPVTKQPLSGTDLIPNHTLRRLIQSWCTMNSHYEFDLVPTTPRKPIDKSHIVKLVNDAKRHPQNQIRCLRRLRSIAQAAGNKTCMEDSSLFEFLTKVIVRENNNNNNNNNPGSVTEACDEALAVVHHLQCADLMLRDLINNDLALSDTLAGVSCPEFVLLDALLRVMRFGSVRSRLHAITFLKSLFKAVDPARIACVSRDLFVETVRILKENVSPQMIKATLEVIVDVIRCGRNRIKAAESGMVSVLIDRLIETSDRRGCELMLVVLEQICRCAEGRAKLVEHAAGLAAVSKKILRVSHVASDRAVRILCLVCRFSGSCGVLQEMVEVGVVSKLCLMIQIDYSDRTKERVKQILMLHSRVWKDASCVPAHLLSSYPSL